MDLNEMVDGSQGQVDTTGNSFESQVVDQASGAEGQSGSAGVGQQAQQEVQWYTEEDYSRTNDVFSIDPARVKPEHAPRYASLQAKAFQGMIQKRAEREKNLESQLSYLQQQLEESRNSGANKYFEELQKEKQEQAKAAMMSKIGGMDEGQIEQMLEKVAKNSEDGEAIAKVIRAMSNEVKQARSQTKVPTEIQEEINQLKKFKEEYSQQQQRMELERKGQQIAYTIENTVKQSVPKELADDPNFIKAVKVFTHQHWNEQNFNRQELDPPEVAAQLAVRSLLGWNRYGQPPVNAQTPPSNGNIQAPTAPPKINGGSTPSSSANMSEEELDNRFWSRITGKTK